ncbi:winged helix-turn-helix transcriptional regulator [Pseudonocardia alni]|uniref:winged helix-turn-helix transcriptional regulator n=2 Tax=Pseudonocardia TaxID=1847 RepID=UPI001AD720FA|nr:helix-turn-helix domain-containing protein [Pseudonocardia alni]MBO4239087.1 transcriptional regulator [Pseudonocardia alni]
MRTEDGTSTAPGEPGVTGDRRGDLFSPDCPTRRLLDRLGTKWTSMVVGSLADGGELRFTELRRRAPGISQKMLSTTLQNLVLDGLVARRVEDTVPPRVHYRLTELGVSLEIPLSALREWAQQNMAHIDDHRTRAGADRADR